MKKLTLLTAIAAALMVGGPGLALCLSGMDAMGATFILFFGVNPLFSAICGAISGSDTGRLWPLPLITAALFLLGVWIYFDARELSFLIYGAGYLLIGWAAMLVSALITRLKQTKQNAENEKE